MTRDRDSRTKRLAIAAALAIVVIAIVVVFSGKKNVGALSVAATLAGGESVAQIDYTISGNDISPITGTTPVADPKAATSFVVKNLPAGSGYLVDLAAASRDGKTKCTRRDSFEVAVAKTTSLSLILICRGPASAVPAFAFKAKPVTRNEAGEVTTEAPVPPACTTCEQTYMASGDCEPESGCEKLDGTDKDLCIKLLNCMRATNCWIKDPGDCYCGTAKDVACMTGAANGDCLAEIQAATKTTDPLKSGELFFDPKVPSGYAARLISCDKEKCINHCAL